ncbi:MAG: PDDEXK nuclease domain-containing protein [Candidatus Absconditabacterales bacterium]
MLKTKSANYSTLISTIGNLLKDARKFAYQQINTILVKTYREIGKHIVEYDQGGKEKAEYGTKLFDKLSRDLKSKYGKGFSRTNLIYIRLLYMRYQKSQTLSDQLSRSHYVELLSIEDDLERSFYEKQCLHEKRSLRELKRQRASALYQRLALSKDKKGILKLANRGNIFVKSHDIIKDPYVFELLGVGENNKYSESDLEQKIIDNMEHFLLELGKCFAFIGRQYRITLNNTHFYVDLVFYHRILKCFVLIDLKVNKLHHTDIGQMNMYLNYFKKEEMIAGDNEPIGIILSADKENTLVEYALGGITNQLFVSKYQLYLPNKKELQEKIDKIINEN